MPLGIIPQQKTDDFQLLSVNLCQSAMMTPMATNGHQWPPMATNGDQWRPMATNGNQTLGAPSATSQYVTAPNMTKLLHFSMSSSRCSELALGSVASVPTRGLTQNVACENRTQLQQGIRTYGYVHFF